MFRSDNKMNVYMDYAATTPVDPRVLKAMLPYFNQEYGNTMSLHKEGRKAKETLEQSRKTIATLMKAKPKELIFTGSATEANNMVIKGVAYALKEKGKHIITTKIEHLAVLNPCEFLATNGYEVTYVSVDEDASLTWAR